MHSLEQLRSGALAGIQRLDLSCGLQRLPPEVFDLADSLEVLNLSGNQLVDLPDDLPRLHRLKVIFCSDNAFTHLPPVLGACHQLQVVGFKANRITTVPGDALPTKLRWLILTDNAIDHLPVELGARPALQKLMLAGNRLPALPATLAGATQLELVRLAANRLTQVPGWLTALPRLSWLALAGNPFGWHRAPVAPLAGVPWQQLRLGPKLGEGASGNIYRVQDQPVALKLFKGAVTSDGLPEHELAACLAAGQHPNLCTPSAELQAHPDGQQGLLLPLVEPSYLNLASPPSLESCTRDVYAPDQTLALSDALKLARGVANAVAHLHQRGVMHGDLYAHNLLWHPANAHVWLTDFGAATVLPTDQPLLCCALQALEVRAFGCLLGELLALTPQNGASDPRHVLGSALADACLLADPAARPSMLDVAHALASGSD